MKSDVVAFLPCFPVPPRPGARHPLACSALFPFRLFVIFSLPACQPGETGRREGWARSRPNAWSKHVERRRSQRVIVRPKIARPSECLIRARLIRSRGVATSFVLPSRLPSWDLSSLEITSSVSFSSFFSRRVVRKIVIINRSIGRPSFKTRIATLIQFEPLSGGIKIALNRSLIRGF